MTKEERIERIEEEASNLESNLHKLAAFIATQGFVELDEMSRELLLTQRNAMRTYHSCLHLRILKLEQEIDNDNI